MRIIVAPDSYKGSVSAPDVAMAMERGILTVFPQAEVIRSPIADGGEGLVDTLVESTGGLFRQKQVRGPLGEPVVARWGILGDGSTAVVEMAEASGLPLVPKERLDPLRASTYGTGELIEEVLGSGLTRLILGIGGSATNDGGSGAASALGVRFLDESGEELPPGGGSLSRLHAIDTNGLDPRLQDMEILVACDVDNPLCGPNGATAVFGPQKGVSPDMVPLLDSALYRYGKIAGQITGRNIMETGGAGGAGGLGAGLLFFTPATLRPGIEVVLEATDFPRHIINADLVIVGEGLTDFQTAFGKAPVGLAKMAKTHGVPVICLSGGLGKGYADVLSRGIDAVTATPARCMSLEECMAGGALIIQDATERLCRILRVGGMLSRAEKGYASGGQGAALDPQGGTPP